MASDGQASTSSNAFSFISKGWREVKDSADADLQLMKARANSFKNLATSFDRELENLFHSATGIRSSHPTEIDFVKKLQPKLVEIRRAYSSPDFSKKVLEKWTPRSTIRIDLSAIKNAIVSEVEDRDGMIEFDRVRRGRSLKFSEFWGEWKREGEDEEKHSVRDWEPIRVLKTRLKEFEKREFLGGFKNSEFVEKVKSSLVCSLLLPTWLLL
jgi:digalactosyldiacylglycerol synthase